MIGCRLLFVMLSSVCAPAAATAQYINSSAPRAGSIEVGVTGTWTNGRDAGSTSATETSNPAVSSNPLTLFKADSRVKPTPGVEGQIGVYVTRAFEVEGALSFSRPVLSVHLTSDFENAGDTTAEETLTHYIVGGSALYHFGRGALRPFVFAGAAYLRQLDEGAADVQTGTELHAGGGVKYWFGRGPRRAGLRLDARVSSRDPSAGLDTRRRATLPTVSAGFAVIFSRRR